MNLTENNNIVEIDKRKHNNYIIYNTKKKQDCND